MHQRRAAEPPSAWPCSARAAGAGGLAPGLGEGKAAGLAEGARGAEAEAGQEGPASEPRPG